VRTFGLEVLSENRIGNRISRHVETISYSHSAQKGLTFDNFITNALHAMNYTIYESRRSQPRYAGVFWHQGYPILLCALLSAVFLLVDVSQLLALLIGVFTLTAATMGLGWDKVISRFSRSRANASSPYSNLVAVHPVQDKPYTVVFTAKYSHYRRKYSQRFSSFLIGSVALISILTVLVSVAVIFTGISRMWIIPPFMLAYLGTIPQLFNGLSMKEKDRRKNASAPAVLLELAQAFAEEAPNANLVFITGEEAEHFNAGSASVLDDPEFVLTFPPERTTVIHLEESGMGDLINISDRYGFPIRQSGILFSKLTQEVCAKFGLGFVSRWYPFGIDSTPAHTAVRGYSSISISTSPSSRKKDDGTVSISSYEYLYGIAQEIVDSIPRIRPYQ
jgi:hypothetical protein